MQFTSLVVVLAAFTSIVSAQYPGCAAECITKADLGSCGPDNKCLCQSAAFVQSTGDCFIKSCTNPDEREAAFKVSRDLCAAAGITSSSDFGSRTAVPTGTTPNTASQTGGASGNATGGSSGSGSNPTQSPSTGKNGALSIVPSAVVGLVGAAVVALAL